MSVNNFDLNYKIVSYYHPQTKFAKVMFLQVSVCPQRGGMHGCSQGGGGACMVAPEGVHGCSGGACMVAPGGACFFQGDMHGFFWGRHAWLLPGGCVWLLPGGMRGFFRGACVGYDEIGSMSGRYASYWHAFLFRYRFTA